MPNLCDDGTDVPCVDGRPGGLASEDAFLQQWVPLILKSPAYLKDGLLAITFDDGPASDTSGCCQASGSATPATGGGRIGTLLLSPHYVTAGGTSTTAAPTRICAVKSPRKSGAWRKLDDTDRSTPMASATA